MLDADQRRLIADRLGSEPEGVRPLSGGCVADAAVATIGGERVVIKSERGAGASLDVEGRMLRYLAERSELPVPRVLLAEPTVLVMTFIESGRPGREAVEAHAGRLLASLHAVRPDGRDDPEAGGGRFGLGFDTLIGGLHQPNPWSSSWPAFYGEHRLVSMARAAHRAGNLSKAGVGLAERAAGRLEGILGGRSVEPGLIHGDVWGGNVIEGVGGVAGFIDPAIYYADPEVELAFITMFSTFGDRFFAAYAEAAGLPGGRVDEGFRDHRRELYTAYPLLVHARLFGGGYAASAERVLRRFAG